MMISELFVGNEWLSARCHTSLHWSLFQHLSSVLNVCCKHWMTVVETTGSWKGEGPLVIIPNGEKKRLMAVCRKQTTQTLHSKANICNKHTDKSTRTMPFTRAAVLHDARGDCLGYHWVYRLLGQRAQEHHYWCSGGTRGDNSNPEVTDRSRSVELSSRYSEGPSLGCPAWLAL